VAAREWSEAGMGGRVEADMAMEGVGRDAGAETREKG